MLQKSIVDPDTANYRGGSVTSLIQKVSFLCTSLVSQTVTSIATGSRKIPQDLSREMSKFVFRGGTKDIKEHAIKLLVEIGGNSIRNDTSGVYTDSTTVDILKKRHVCVITILLTIIMLF